MTQESPTACVFCQILGGELTPGVVAFRDSHTAVFPSLGQQPRNRGHMLVVPIRHVAYIYDVDDDLAGPLILDGGALLRTVLVESQKHVEVGDLPLQAVQEGEKLGPAVARPTGANHLAI